MKRRSSFVVVTLALLCMAPTAGDIGGCGADVTALDPNAFANARKQTDCERCKECSIHTARCTSACDAKKPPETSIPKTCQPLYHDGEVCLRKLKAVSCDTYATYVTDLGPSTPSECEFCKVPPEETPSGTFGSGDAGSQLTDAGAQDGAR